MKIKFHWGTGIVISIVVFVSFFISFIIFSLTQDINLVSKEYFPDEIEYQTQINKLKNARELKEKIQITKINEYLLIDFPKEMQGSIEGIIHFFCVSDNNLDKKFRIKTDDNQRQIINTNQITKGRYTIKIDWKDTQNEYYQESNITF